VVSDRDLVDRYLTDDVAEAVGLGGGADEPSARERILRLLGNGGVPRIVVEGVRSGRLLLQHGHDGRDLAADDLPGALAAVARLWGGDGVELSTMDGGRPCRFVWAGGQLTTT
jgi:spore cortex formation protein SpoVR/YcgB (stage V sporulation)